ncbi:uncharacterized protein TNCV_1685641 [Trichonephila clavipes]|nr:uncharacterized protein TNCV_1685641 [Trichonephila clavipes]
MYKGNLARNRWCSRRQRIDEAGISTPVAVDQHPANCLEKALRSFTAMRISCRSSHIDVTFLRSLLVFNLFRAVRSTASKLASLWICFVAHDLLLRDRKVIHLEGQ